MEYIVGHGGGKVAKIGRKFDRLLFIGGVVFVLRERNLEWLKYSFVEAVSNSRLPATTTQKMLVTVNIII